MTHAEETADAIGYLSVCAGIEAVSEAWRGLPFRPVMLSEIEAFPRAVLEQRHAAACVRRSRPAGTVPLWGDFTALRMRHLIRLGMDPAEIGVLIGGTPCQAFSAAGQRGGLSDARGNLSLAFVSMANAIDNLRRARGRPPLVICWENVSGVLTMPDNSFGFFLAALVGASAPIIPTTGARWTDAGMVVGPRRAAAWRLLDAQYFGLAQRRRRVILVASAGGECPASVLFESDGVRRHTAPRRQARKDLTGTLGARTSGGGGFGTDLELDGGLVAAKPNAAQDERRRLLAASGGDRTSGELDTAATLLSQPGLAEVPLVPMAFDCKSSGQMGAGDGAIAPTLRAMGHKASHANAGGQVAAASREGVRRLTPREWERLQGFPDDYTAITYRGKPAADGPRYKALGNSMPVPVMRWLGRRLAAYLRRGAHAA